MVRKVDGECGYALHKHCTPSVCYRGLQEPMYVAVSMFIHVWTG